VIEESVEGTCATLAAAGARGVIGGYTALNPSIEFNGRRPFSSDDCGLVVNLPPWISSGVARKPSNPNKARLAAITSDQRFRVPGRDEKPAYRRADVISVRYPTKEGRMRMKIGIVGVTCRADGEEKGRLNLLIDGSGEAMEMFWTSRADVWRCITSLAPFGFYK
jgi:hypothetical protein